MIKEKTAFFTEVQTILRQARDEKSEVKLRKGADLMNSTMFQSLPHAAQGDLSFLYAEAHLAATGALVG